MKRQTSIDIYHRIEAEGLLSKYRLLVYQTIFKHGPLTIKETCKILSHLPETSVSPVFAQLEKRDVIYSESKRPCTITGNMVHSWDVTHRLPVEFDKPKKLKCKSCNGAGYHIEQQARLFK